MPIDQCLGGRTGGCIRLRPLDDRPEESRLEPHGVSRHRDDRKTRSNPKGFETTVYVDRALAEFIVA